MAGRFPVRRGGTGSVRHSVSAVWALLLASAMALAPGGCSENVKKPAAVITMEKGGEFRIEFYAEDAPKTVENFVTLAKKGFYNGLTFHRVHPNVSSTAAIRRATAPAAPATPSRPSSTSRSTCGARWPWRAAMSPDSAGSQFYIMLGGRRIWTASTPCSAGSRRAWRSSTRSAGRQDEDGEDRRGGAVVPGTE